MTIMFNKIKYINIFLLLSIIIFIYKTSNIMFIKVFYKLFLLVILLYSSLNFILQLNTKSVNTKSNSFNQKFYKIAFTSFWIIEFFLFFIICFLTLIAPAEPLYALDLVRCIIVSPRPSVYTAIFLACCSYFVAWTFDCVLFNKVSLKTIECTLYFLLCTILMFFVFLYEFFKFYNILSFYKYKIFRYVNKKSGIKIYNYNNKKSYRKQVIRRARLDFIRKMRTVHFFMMLIALLKFWHVFFIFNFFYFTMLKIVNNKQLSNDLLSFNIQNQLYSIVFTYLSFIIFFKKEGMVIWVFIKQFYVEHNWNIFKYNYSLEVWGFIKDFFYTALEFVYRKYC